MARQKYRFMKAENIVVNGSTITAQRIIALRDIPRHNVKAGDIGGYIACYNDERTKNAYNLSHKGDCWIAGNAVVIGSIVISGNAIVKEKAILKGKTTWLLRRPTSRTNTTFNMLKPSGYVTDDAVISGEAFVVFENQASISEKTKIRDNAIVILTRKPINDSYKEKADLLGVTTISGKAYVNGLLGEIKDCYLGGTVKLSDSSHLSKISLLEGEYVGLKQDDYDLRNVIPLTMHDTSNTDAKKNSLPVTKNGITLPTVETVGTMEAKDEKYKKKLHKLEEAFNSYQHDIVKLIKYPLMADMSNPDILNFAHALNASKALMEDNDMDDFASSVKHAERLFIVAESKTRTALDTTFDSKGQSKLKTAQSLLAIAYNAGSTENEKKISCERVLKELRGIIPLEDKLIENLRVSVGLKELEA